jgi:hypothetical protein
MFSSTGPCSMWNSRYPKNIFPHRSLGNACRIQTEVHDRLRTETLRHPVGSARSSSTCPTSARLPMNGRAEANALFFGKSDDFDGEGKLAAAEGTE